MIIRSIAKSSKRILILLFVLFFSGIAVASSENFRIDSLLIVLEKSKIDSVRIICMLDIGDIYWDSLPEKAYDWYQQGLELAIEAIEYSDIPAEKNRYYSLAGVCCRYSSLSMNKFGKSDEAIDFMKKAIEFYKLSGIKKKISNSYIELGNLYMGNGDYGSCIESYHKAKKIAVEINDSVQINRVINNLGVVSIYMKNYTEAINYLKEAKEYSYQLNDTEGVAFAINNIGTIHLTLHQYDTALTFFNEAIEITRRINSSAGLARNLNNIGICNRHMKKFHKALDAYEEAFEINSKSGDKQGMASVLINKGYIYLETKRFLASIKSFNEAITIAKEMNLSNEAKDAYFGLSKAYKETGKFDKAYEYSLEYSILIDSLFNAENSLIYQEMSAKFQNEQKQFEIDKKNQELLHNKESIQRQQMMIYIFIAFFIVIIAFSILFFRQFRAKKKAYVKLEEQNEKMLQQTEEIISQAERLNEINQDLEKLSIVARETDNSVIITDAQGQIQWVNQSFSKLYGYSLDEYISKMGSTLQEVSTNEKIKSAVEQSTRDKVPVSYISHFQPEAGEKKWLQTTLSPVLDSKGEVTNLVAIDSDITKLKIVEEEVKRQRDKIIKQNEEITESIEYAGFIQMAILPLKSEIDRLFPENFILYKPKDIVSGDFYWCMERNNTIIIVVADCTGHGVPGAFMSMLGIAFLNEIVSKESTGKPEIILNNMRDNVVKALHQTGKEDEAKDGMEMSICSIDRDNGSMLFAGAKSSLLFSSNGEINEVKGDRMPVSIYYTMESFSSQEISYKSGDNFYLFTDGYPDQFGGPQSDKFKKQGLKNLISEIHKLPMVEQKYRLEKNITDWQIHTNPATRKFNEQLDDMLIFGFRL